jgi:polyisoprenoid-binding protein YceI
MITLLIAIFLMPPFQENSNNFLTDHGKVKFKSDAQLEIIDASSNQLKGILNPDNRHFAFAVTVSSFTGFNAALQRDHFNENYLESDKYPMATFAGKIIEEIDFSKKQTIEARAKGMLNIHGVEQERIILTTLTINEKTIDVHSKFNVSLKDHDIRVPKVVHEKIASEISIEVDAELKK